MKTSWVLIVSAVCLQTVSVEAQTRTWGFSRDGVNEWAANGDTVSIVNLTTDTLKFDTTWLEPIGPAPQGSVVRFYRVNTSAYYALSTGSLNWGPNPRALAVPSSQSIQLGEFWIDIDAPPLAKAGVGAATGDTLRARLIFLASAGRGRDTLLVNGIQQTTSIRPASPPWKSAGADGNRLFDPLGRRVELRENGRIPMAPLLDLRD